MRQARRGAALAVGGVLSLGAAGWLQGTPVASATEPPGARLGNPDDCARYSGLPPGWGVAGHAGMRWVAGGRFTPGANDGYPDERPAGEVRVDSFWMDRTEVTNAQFAAFVQATGHVTDAERSGSAAVFRVPRGEGGMLTDGAGWHDVQGANWRHPEGPGSDLRGRHNQPVVQVTRGDAQAYARWLGRTLPSEAQWEYAARANGQGERIERGPRNAQGRPAANFWQGQFPDLDLAEDGHAGRAPVGCFAPNGLGLLDMIGNVWEWTGEPWRGARQAHGAAEPKAPAQPGAPGLIKGGSFLCAADFCVRYRASARFPQDTTLGAAHVGFRTVAMP